MGRNFWIHSMCGAALLLVANAAFAQEALLHNTFEEKTEGWIAVGPQSRIRVVTEAEAAKSGKGALEFQYTIQEKLDAKGGADPPVDVLIRPTPGGMLAKMRSLRFAVRVNNETPLFIALAEKDGGRYTTSLWVGKGGWQEIALAPEDFVLSTDKNDPKDPNNQLDLAAVENIMLVNPLVFLAPMLSQSEQGGISEAALRIGKHTLWLDDFMVSAEPLASPKPDPAAIESYHRDIVRWFGLGELEMKIDPAAPTKTRALRVDYRQGDSSYISVIRTVSGLPADAGDSLSFDFAAAKSSRMVMTLEEQNGAKYALQFAIPGDSDPIHRVFALSEFALDENSKDTNQQLDITQVKSLSITDVTGAFGLPKQKNTLWIGPIRLQKK